MPLRKPWDHGIDLKEDFSPKKGRIIPLSVDEQKEVEAFLDDQLSKGYIWPSSSQQTSPVFFVPKKDGKKRMVQDYCYLNEWTVKNNYPLPLISQLVDKLKGCKLFMKMDLQWGYNNVRIREGDEWKAAFTTHKGSFEPLVMYFGLCNSPATFQKMMNEIFHDMSDVCVVYICHDRAQPLPRPSCNSDPSPATPKLIAVPQLNPRHYVNLWPRTSLYHLLATCPV